MGRYTMGHYRHAAIPWVCLWPSYPGTGRVSAGVNLSLPLLVPRIRFADNAYNPLAADELAFFAHSADTGTHFHIDLSPVSIPSRWEADGLNYPADR
jgi:hypothetical protein